MALPEFPDEGIFATYDEDGKATGFYLEVVHGRRLIPVERLVPASSDRLAMPTVTYDYVPNPDCKIPEDAVPITRAEWKRQAGMGDAE